MYPMFWPTHSEVADKIEPYTIESKPVTPNFPIPASFSNADDYLRALTYNGAVSRYGELTDVHKRGLSMSWGQ